MVIVVSGGGTAGHINPALALAEELTSRGCDVYFVGTPCGVEARLVPQEGIAFVPFEAKGFNRNHPLSLGKALLTIQKSTRLACKWFRDIKPAAVVGFGGYVCIPVGRAAQKLGIPVVVHEQNSVMGLANRYLSKRAGALCLTYGGAGQVVRNTARITVTGNPVRAKVLSATRAQGRLAFGVPDDAPLLLITGGSLGARHVNQALLARSSMLLSYDDLHIVHITGSSDFDATRRALSHISGDTSRWQVHRYTDQMGLALAAADIIVSRSGATTLAEISARTLPALLIPYPHATGDHQTKNAQEYTASGAACMVADSDLESDVFEDALRSLIEDEQLRTRMAACARTTNACDAAARVADVVMKAALS